MLEHTQLVMNISCYHNIANCINAARYPWSDFDRCPTAVYICLYTATHTHTHMHMWYTMYNATCVNQRTTSWSRKMRRKSIWRNGEREGGREKRGVWLEKGTVCIGGFTCRYLKGKLQPKFVFKSYVCTAHLPQIKDRSSEYFKEGNIRTSGSYIYEEFMPTDGIDIKVYAVGLDYAHAEARKSAVRGVGREEGEGPEPRIGTCGCDFCMLSSCSLHSRPWMVVWREMNRARRRDFLSF